MDSLVPLDRLKCKCVNKDQLFSGWRIRVPNWASASTKNLRIKNNLHNELSKKNNLHNHVGVLSTDPTGRTLFACLVSVCHSWPVDFIRSSGSRHNLPDDEGTLITITNNRKPFGFFLVVVGNLALNRSGPGVGEMHKSQGRCLPRTVSQPCRSMCLPDKCMFVFQYTWLVGASSPNFESSIHDTHFAKNEKKKQKHCTWQYMTAEVA